MNVCKSAIRCRLPFLILKKNTTKFVYRRNSCPAHSPICGKPALNSKNPAIGGGVFIVRVFVFSIKKHQETGYCRYLRFSNINCNRSIPSPLPQTVEESERSPVFINPFTHRYCSTPPACAAWQILATGGSVGLRARAPLHR